MAVACPVFAPNIPVLTSLSTILKVFADTGSNQDAGFSVNNSTSTISDTVMWHELSWELIRFDSQSQRTKPPLNASKSLFLFSIQQKFGYHLPIQIQYSQRACAPIAVNDISD